MCIVLLTTAHPRYALIVLDNRDEYILRPTSRPHWWTASAGPHVSCEPTPDPNGPAEAKPTGQVEVLSSRDLQRAEKGTWLGITKGGNFAVLTNYRETDTHDAARPVSGQRSRGGMVTAWLGADPAETTEQFVHRMLDDGGVKGVGGFSLICGKLRKTKGTKNMEPLAIISNRCDRADEVPWICGERGSAYGLSNTTYVEASEENKDLIWPKIRNGIDMLNRAVADAVSEAAGEEELVASLFKILDVDNFPSNHTVDLEEVMPFLKDSIFIPAFGDEKRQKEMSEARQRGTVKPSGHHSAAAETLAITARPDEQPNGFQTGLYGTQRQTVILVDWDGNVRYTERSLWDCHGNAIPRGAGDETFRFKIDGWEQEPELSN